MTAKGLLIKNCFCKVVKLMCAALNILFFSFCFQIWLSNRKLGLPPLTVLFTDWKSQAARGAGEGTGFPGEGEPYHVAGALYTSLIRTFFCLIDMENKCERNNYSACQEFCAYSAHRLHGETPGLLCLEVHGNVRNTKRARFLLTGEKCVLSMLLESLALIFSYCRCKDVAKIKALQVSHRTKSEMIYPCTSWNM